MIEVARLTKQYEQRRMGKALYVFRDFSCRFEGGTITALLGVSGSGKTTFARILCGLEKEYEGDISIAGKPLVEYLYSNRISFVPQQHSNFPWMTTRENIDLGKKESLGDLETYIRELGLSGYSELYPHQLSGGLQQRVAVARALTHRSRIIVFDEPFSNLDEDMRFRSLELVRPVLKESLVTSIFITHRIEEAFYISDRVIVFPKKPIASAVEFASPHLERNRDYYFHPQVIELRKKIAGLLRHASSNEFTISHEI